jgi:predicted aspartyl protease
MLTSDFVSGAITFLDSWDENDRIVIPVKFDEEIILAIVDTGAPYCVLAPNVADRIGIDRTAGHQPRGGLSTRFGTIRGWLCRVPVVLEAEIGEGVAFETTVFIPDDEWPDDRNFIGLSNFLFQLRFAIDPQENLFYFGGPI